MLRDKKSVILSSKVWEPLFVESTNKNRFAGGEGVKLVINWGKRMKMEEY